jgi:hypothetical protein
LLLGDAGLVGCVSLSTLRARRGRRLRAEKKSIFAEKGLDAILFIN